MQARNWLCHSEEVKYRAYLRRGNWEGRGRKGKTYTQRENEGERMEERRYGERDRGLALQKNGQEREWSGPRPACLGRRREFKSGWVFSLKGTNYCLGSPYQVTGKASISLIWPVSAFHVKWLSLNIGFWHDLSLKMTMINTNFMWIPCKNVAIFLVSDEVLYMWVAKCIINYKCLSINQ